LGEEDLSTTNMLKRLVKPESKISGDMDLVISTCLERNGDLRLVSGWKVITQ